MGTFSTNYRRKYYPRPRSQGTRYRSTRKTPGVYRSTSRTIVSGAARKRFGRLQVMNALKSIAEHKYWDVVKQFDGTDGYISTQTRFFSLSDVAIGATDETRIGDKVTPTTLEFRYASYPEINNVSQDQWFLRITIFQWKDDSVPAQADLYEATGGVGQIDNLPSLWPFTHDNSIKRKILYDKSIGSIGTSNNTGIITTDNKSIKCEKIIIPFTKVKKSKIWFQNNQTIGVNVGMCSLS